MCTPKNLELFRTNHTITLMAQRTFGVTPPISNANPTPGEILTNNELIRVLKARGSFESEQATKKRVEVLNTLQKLAEEFVYLTSKKKNMTDGMAKDAGGKIFTFGSYRLGVYGPGSDIDALVVVPKHVNRQDFFEIFVQLLKKRPELEELAAVPDAFVPIIKIEFAGISIDLICAKLDISKVPRDLTLDNKNLLKNLDERDMRSLNGTRVTDEILQLVPKTTTFKHALRCIKMWAQQRGVYANVFGYPGGVAWAMLVARICQLYPNAVSSVIIEKFFQIYSQWKWPEPVLLKQIEDGPLQVRVWNPKLYANDRQHRMPVITPAYPSMCATHNITSSTMAQILKELNRGMQITAGILKGTNTWDELFERHRFFHEHKFYLCIVAATKSVIDEHLKWSGMIESKLRLLVQKLEVVDGVKLALPYFKTFEHAFKCKNEQEQQKMIELYGTLAGEAIAQEHSLTDEQMKSISGEVSELHLTKLFIGLDIIEGQKKLDIQNPCSDFFGICKGWSDFDEKMHVIQIKKVKLSELPNDVYVEGEARPQRTTKRKKLGIESDAAKRLKSIDPTPV